jgi:hypothetical protein
MLDTVSVVMTETSEHSALFAACFLSAAAFCNTISFKNLNTDLKR